MDIYMQTLDDTYWKELLKNYLKNQFKLLVTSEDCLFWFVNYSRLVCK